MSYDNTPHVCFKVDLAPNGSADDEVPRLLERHLRTRFDSVRVIKTGFLAPLAVELRAAAKTFSAVLGRNKYEGDEWILIVGPLEGPGLLDRLLGRKPISEVPDLMLTCREIHGMLTAISSITAVRWYFEGRNTQSAAVATADELPWPRG
ncbi:MAG: hypothetical protein ACJ8R9_25875 [Steroidobacteraceae bacterium]